MLYSYLCIFFFLNFRYGNDQAIYFLIFSEHYQQKEKRREQRRREEKTAENFQGRDEGTTELTWFKKR